MCDMYIVVNATFAVGQHHHNAGSFKVHLVMRNSTIVIIELGIMYVVASIQTVSSEKGVGPTSHELFETTLLHTIAMAAAAHSVAPTAMYSGVRSVSPSSLLGNAVDGYVALSARCTKNSETLPQVTLT